MMCENINWLAVVVAAIASMVIGALWYGPFFGKPWMKLAGITQTAMKKAKKGMWKRYLIGLINRAVMAAILALIINLTQLQTVLTGIVMGILVWLGFIATVSLGGVLWEGKKFKFYILNNGFELISIIAMGAIIGAWPV